MISVYEKFWLLYALVYSDGIVVKVQFWEGLFSLFGGLGKGEHALLASCDSGGKITAPFLQKAQRQAVHRTDVVRNKRRTCTDQGKHRNT